MDMTSGGFDLLHDTLTVPPVHIPDGNGGAYKTELVLERTPDRTVKILWWHADDPRDLPHDHPWAFESEILTGGYTEQRWRPHPNPARPVLRQERVYRAGDVNVVALGWFHNVTNVLPGTVTRMTCGPAREGNQWNYLDPATGQLIDPGDINTDFRADLQAINPHLR